MLKKKITSEWKHRVKGLMKKRGITQEKLAEKMNLSQGAVSHFFSSPREPSISILLEISNILEVTLIFLLFGEETNWPFSISKSEFDALSQQSKNDIEQFISYKIDQKISWPFSISKSEFDVLPQQAKKDIEDFLAYQLFQHSKNN